MPGIAEPLKDLLEILSDLDVVNGDGQTVKLYTRVWNNQIRYEEDGKLYNYPKPAAFIEIVSPATFAILGQDYRSVDISFRIHLSHDNYNSEGTFEQDLRIFDLRDKIVGWITGRRLTNCGPLEGMSEDQDYQHANVYHYILEFVCNFTDTSGSRLDTNRHDHFINSGSPTALDLDVNIDNDQARQPVNTGYTIPGKIKKY